MVSEKSINISYLNILDIWNSPCYVLEKMKLEHVFRYQLSLSNCTQKRKKTLLMGFPPLLIIMALHH